MFSIRALKRRSGFTLDVNIEVASHGVVALFGRSGCGKTTLIDIVAGLLTAEEARIVIEGVVLEDTALRQRLAAERRRIGYVFQNARLFPHLSVSANLRYGEHRAGPAERRIGFDQVSDLLGLAPLLQRRAHELSGGERQRVALGRALLSQPRLLLLDEPLASLDAARREEVLPYFEKLRDELAIPIVYVSHQFDEVLRLATHVVLIEAGRVVAQGELDAISLHPALRAIVGPDAIGAVLPGSVSAVDASTGLASVRVGGGELNVALRDEPIGAPVRVQLLARDVILATTPPENLSVRNTLTGTVTQLIDDGGGTDLVTIDVGGSLVLSRVTRAASRALSLRPGLRVWVLVKAVSLRAHRFAEPRAQMGGGA